MNIEFHWGSNLGKAFPGHSMDCFAPLAMTCKQFSPAFLSSFVFRLSSIF